MQMHEEFWLLNTLEKQADASRAGAGILKAIKCNRSEARLEKAPLVNSRLCRHSHRAKARAGVEAMALLGLR